MAQVLPFPNDPNDPLYSLGGCAGRDYDPTAFYCTSVDDKGHQKEIRVKLPPPLYARIMSITKSGQLDGTPIKSPQDFFRDSAAHRLHTLEEYLITDPTHLKWCEALRNQATLQQEMQRVRDANFMVEEVEQGWDLAREAGDKTAMKVLVEACECQAEVLGEPYAERIEKVGERAAEWLDSRG